MPPPSLIDSASRILVVLGGLAFAVVVLVWLFRQVDRRVEQFFQTIVLIRIPLGVASLMVFGPWATMSIPTLGRLFANLFVVDSAGAAVTVSSMATFPYVSPIAAARMLDPAEEVGDHLALGDGGYFDNLGFGTAVDWLRDVEHSVPGARYCFVHVRPPADELGPTDVGNKASGNQDAERWRREVLGPIELLLEARDTTQAQRAEIGEDLLRRWLGERYASVTLAPLGTSRVPLSWHLSREETKALRRTWDPGSEGEVPRGGGSANDEALGKLVEFLGR